MERKNNIILIMPKYSIIVTTYNDEKYIEQCVRSVLEQTFSDFELIIVNDGSSDNTRDILTEITDERVILLNQENKGTVYSRERGICKATGDYLMFLDADDWWDRDLLEKINNIIIQTKTDIVQFGYKFKDENGNDTLDAGLSKKGALENIEVYDGLDSYGYKALEMCYSLWSRAFKRSLFDKEQGFYAPFYDVKMTNDLLAFSRPLSLSKTYCFANFYPYNYRIVNDSTCHNVSIDKVDSYFKSITWAEHCMNMANGITYNHKIFFSNRLATMIFDEYRETIFGSKSKQIRHTYSISKKMPKIRDYLLQAEKEEQNWYRKLFLKSFRKEWIVLPKLLLWYAKIKERINK